MTVKHQYELQDGLSSLSPDRTDDSRINIVFVHGLGGGAFSTWNSGDDSELGFWPSALAHDHPSSSVWTLHYTARILEWNPFARSRTIDILDKSGWFLDQLVRNKINENPIVFVSHSLGGVLVKQALQFSQSFGPTEWRSIWEQTQAVIFLATPHVGSRFADFGIALAQGIRGTYRLAYPFLRPSPALRHLEKNKPTLRYLRDWYRDQAPAQGIDTIAYAEGRPLSGAMVVDIESANPQVPNCATPLLSDQDHISIAKPRRRADTVYSRVDECITELEESVRLGRVHSYAARPALDREAMTRLREARDMISELAGCWWERIEADELNHLSFFRIRPDPLTNSIYVGGRSYQPDGNAAADWNSKIARIDRDGQRLIISYFWTGEHVTRERAGIGFHGFGEMKFDSPLEPNERIERGTGGFWEVNESQPEQTRYKSIELRRINDPSVIEKMDKGSTASQGSRVRDVLQDW